MCNTGWQSKACCFPTIISISWEQQRPCLLLQQCVWYNICMCRRLQGTGSVLENFTDIKHRLCFVCFSLIILKNKFSLQVRSAHSLSASPIFRVHFACTIVHRISLPHNTELVGGVCMSFSLKKKKTKLILYNALSFEIYPQTKWLYKRSTIYVDLFGDFLFMDVLRGKMRNKYIYNSCKH